MQIIIERRDVYGRPTYYPVCRTAKLFAELAGTKTLTQGALRTIREMGVAIDQPTAAPIRL